MQCESFGNMRVAWKVHCACRLTMAVCRLTASRWSNVSNNPQTPDAAPLVAFP